MGSSQDGYRTIRGAFAPPRLEPQHQHRQLLAVETGPQAASALTASDAVAARDIATQQPVAPSEDVVSQLIRMLASLEEEGASVLPSEPPATSAQGCIDQRHVPQPLAVPTCSTLMNGAGGNGHADRDSPTADALRKVPLNEGDMMFLELLLSGGSFGERTGPWRTVEQRSSRLREDTQVVSASCICGCAVARVCIYMGVCVCAHKVPPFVRIYHVWGRADPFPSE